MKPLFLLITIVLLASCSLNYDGDIFYTIDGVVVDSLNHPVANVEIMMRNQDGGTVNDIAVSARTMTNRDGKYRLTYPSNNGVTDIGVKSNPFSVEELRDDFEEFQMPFTDNPTYDNWFFVRVNAIEFNDFYYRADTIRIIPQP